MTLADLRALPDVPRWVEAHGLAADPTSWSAPLGDGLAVGHDAAQLIVVTGDADPAAAAALARARPHHALLCAIERDTIAEALRATAARSVSRALLHTLPDPAALPALAGALPLPADAPLDHLPPPLADELATARARTTVWATWLDDAPVSFAYAPWRSARWFDISVDTLPAARQLGLATITAAALIEAERAEGRQPVWGADEDNVASRRLAAVLGFVATDALWVAAPEAG